MNSSPFSGSGSPQDAGAPRSVRSGIDPLVRSRLMLLLATAVTVVLLFVPYAQQLLYPLRLFVTFVHESGHALATVLTGGQVEYIRIAPSGSGVTYSVVSPWAQGLVDSAGYLGATLFGALLLQFGRLSRWRHAGRAVLYAVAAYLLCVVLLWCNPLHSGAFTFIAGLSVVALLLLAGRFASPQVAEFLAAFLAVQCCLDALIDLRVLIGLTANDLGQNDATNMAHAVGLTPTFWAVLWALVAIGILMLSVLSYWRGTSRRKRQVPMGAGL
ncbi:Peptidase M50B [Chthonomonas calidirosea]|uniref:Peptidase M50B-like n=1 Tax=Chthonomonas calidirosea (strain DSM 23976 / ICMP 18418 / T49) TaxID=1303518 RepID=S0EWB7_CHTCT|nr:M50 family metallopeptidase [Chthonomonas calidirosea]CCW36096.1 Peptidase M50B-like [Chthonomonas calidirosea T49]CEK18347.1 Peptidase M50B [Chthonomonas calidirosea]